MTPPRILFAGTPAFARASLSALLAADLRPVAVLTQPDRRAGRGRRLTASPVKALAEEVGIEVYQPRTLRDPEAQEQLRAYRPDLLIVAAYGLLLPQAILDIPTHGCLNVHASLLPRWRGAAPIQAAILAGDDKSGVCLMQMEAGLDTGPVFAAADVRLTERMTAGDLHDVLAELGGSLLVENLAAIVSGELTSVGQDESLATYAGKIDKTDAQLDWSLDAHDVDRRVRAYNPVPGANFGLGGERIKVWRATPLTSGSGQPGEVLQADRDAVVVACGSGALAISELQRPGRGRVSAQEFVNQVDLAGSVLD